MVASSTRLLLSMLRRRSDSCLESLRLAFTSSEQSPRCQFIQRSLYTLKKKSFMKVGLTLPKAVFREPYEPTRSNQYIDPPRLRAALTSVGKHLRGRLRRPLFTSTLLFSFHIYIPQSGPSAPGGAHCVGWRIGTATSWLSAG